MAELKFQPSLQDSPLKHYTVLPRLRIDIIANGETSIYSRQVPALVRGRQKREQETGVKFTSCFFTLQITTKCYWAEGTQEEKMSKVCSSPFYYPQVFHFLGFLTWQLSHLFATSCGSPVKEHWFKSQTGSTTHSSYVTVSKLFNFSVAQYPLSKNENNTFLIG